MSEIPRSVSMLMNMDHKALQDLLKAALIRLSADDEDASLVITEREMQRASSYALVTTTVPEENAIVLSVRLR